MALGHKRSIISCVSLLFDFRMLRAENICESIDQSLVISLHIITLKVRYAGWLVQGRKVSFTVSLDRWLYVAKISIMTGFILKVDELLCFFEVH